MLFLKMLFILIQFAELGGSINQEGVKGGIIAVVSVVL